mgnify:CR=1 FL=1
MKTHRSKCFTISTDGNYEVVLKISYLMSQIST